MSEPISPTHGTPDARTVDEIADSYVEELIRLDPYEATFAGAAGYDHLSTDLSPMATPSGLSWPAARSRLSPPRPPATSANASQARRCANGSGSPWRWMRPVSTGS